MHKTNKQYIGGHSRNIRGNYDPWKLPRTSQYREQVFNASSNLRNKWLQMRELPLQGQPTYSHNAPTMTWSLWLWDLYITVHHYVHYGHVSLLLPTLLCSYLHHLSDIGWATWSVWAAIKNFPPKIRCLLCFLWYSRSYKIIEDFIKAMMCALSILMY